jgi:hypothetical protein
VEEVEEEREDEVELLFDPERPGMQERVEVRRRREVVRLPQRERDVADPKERRERGEVLIEVFYPPYYLFSPLLPPIQLHHSFPLI